METDDYKDCKRKLKEMGIEYNHPLHPANKSGVNGVSFRKARNVWVVVIFSNHKRIHLGEFKNFEDAVMARLKAEDKYGVPLLSSYRKERPKKLSGSYFIDLSGRKFEHFSVVRHLGPDGGLKGAKCVWECLCECGNYFVASSTQINLELINSCGCIPFEKKEINHRVKKTNLGFFADGSSYTSLNKKEANGNSRTGIKGIYQDRCGTWYAKLVFKGVTYRVKCSSELEAIYKRKELVNVAHDKGLSIEAEVGAIGGTEDGITADGEVADPEECKKIIDLGVDFLAAGIGNIHGIYPANWSGLHFDALDKINKATGNIPLVLHGGTGIPDNQIVHAIKDGVSKINVNTDCQLAFAEATIKYCAAGKADPTSANKEKGYDPRKLLKPGFEAIKAKCVEKIKLFGSEGKADEFFKI